eukprot:CAMPEP_0195523576 /NCGR_PEP_ID=MMETSP0794_2-20130614/22832_1 /TAXON_ID=515487 /ORGANISM="Stephanopyxis turris, Strain CCMP 815" /LENGTH=163 /DNA_ID=CAMNT_0040653599 /DNA_START=66 /DNA_END=554 /DNA_ORIENTATION=+
MTVERTWACKCGEIKVKLTGEPILSFRCHCHSCVGAAQFIEEKTNKSGIPIIHENGGGVCACPYAASQLEFLSELSSSDGTSKLKFVRVGDKGKALRSYTTCCGTQMTNFILPGLIVFNQNGIKNADGSSFESAKPVLNIEAYHAFDPSTVPEPKHATHPVHW